MSSKALHRLAGGLLATLLALFAAVVVARPAVAAEATTVLSAGDLAQALFGNDYASDGVTLSGTNTVVVPAGKTVSTETTTVNGIFLKGEYTLTVNGTVNVPKQIVLEGSALTVNGSGEINASSNTYGVFQVGTVEGDAPTATSVTSGSLTVNGPVTIQNSTSQNSGAIYIAQGTATLTGGATIECENSIKGTGAVQVGPASITGGLGTANLNVVDATITGDCGVSLWNHGGVVVNDGAEITGTGSTAENELCSGAGIAVVAAADNADVNLEVNGGEITGASNGIITTYSKGGSDSDNPTTAGIDASKVTANVDVNGGTITAEKDDGTLGTAAFDNNFSNADVSVTGGTFTGTTAFESAASGAQVSGGTFSTPVDPAQVDPSLKVMGVIPGKKGVSTYQYFESPAAATAAGSTANINLTGQTTTDIIAVGVIPGKLDPDAKGVTPIEDALKSVGISSGTLFTAAESSDKAENTLYVVYYGEASTYTATAQLLTVANNMNEQTGENGFSFATLSLNNSAANLSAGTYTVKVSASGGQAAQQTIDVAGVSVAQVTADSQASMSAIESGATATPYFFEANSSAEPIDLPTITPNPLSSGAVSGGATQPLAVGWYQLTPAASTAAGTLPTTFTAALYSGDTYTPSNATMTYLEAGYAAMPEAGSVTASLSPFSPANVVAGNEATSTLTLTVSEDALGGSVVLATPGSGFTVSNAPKLEAGQDAVTNGVALALKNALTNQKGGVGTASYRNPVNLVWSPVKNAGGAWTGTAGSNTWTAAKEGPTVSGNTITDTITVTPSAYTEAYTVALVMNLENLGVEEAGSPGVPNKIEIQQPAAVMTVYTAPNANIIGNGSVNKTAVAGGAVTYTAVPGDGATFTGWTIVYKSTTGTGAGITETATSTSITLTPEQQETIYSITANFEGGYGPVTPTGNTPVYRLYNTATGEHLLTQSTVEVDALIKGDWITDGYDGNQDGIAFYELPAGTKGTPIYRLYDPSTGTHMYTSDVNEKNTLAREGWHQDFNGNAMFMAPTSSSYPVYRLYNGSLPLNISHLWTASYNEYNTLSHLTGAQYWAPEPSVDNPVAWWATGVPTGPDL